jgi:hypothetical protein
LGFRVKGLGLVVLGFRVFKEIYGLGLEL